MEAGAGGLDFGWAVDEGVLLARGQVFKGEFEVDAVAVGSQVDEFEEVLRRGAGAEAAVKQGLGPVGDDFGGVEVVERAEAVALGTCAEGGVEAEAARLQLGYVEAAVGAGHGGGEQLLFVTGNGDQGEAVGQLQRLGYGQVEAFFDRGLTGGEGWSIGCRRLEQDAVDDGFDGVVLAPVEEERLGEVAEFAVDAGAEALPVKLVEEVLELALAAADDGRHDSDALAPAEIENALSDLFGGLAGDGPAAVGAMGCADRGVEQAQVVVDLGDGADGGAWAAAGGLLLDGDGRAKALNGVHIGALDLVEELAGVGGEGFDVAALAFGIDGVEGQRALARAGEAGDHRERIAGDAHADVAQVVLARPAHRDVSDGHDEAMWERRAVPDCNITGLQYSWGYSIGQQKQGSTRGFFCENRRGVFLRRAGEDFGRPGRRNVDVAGSRTASEGESNGGFVEFGDVDFGVGGLDGIWHTGGLWNPSRGVCADAPAAEAGGGEDAAGSGAGVVKRLGPVNTTWADGVA